MRTRTSNRAKKFTPQKYDFESSSDAEAPSRDAASSQRPNPNPKPAPRPRRRAASAAAASSSSSSAFEAADSGPDGNSPDGNSPAAEAAPDDDTAAAAAAPARRAARVKKARPAAKRPPSGYVQVESVTTDTHMKGYVGPYDRSMRGQTLISTWYGPDADDVRLAQRLLDRWIGWTVLPPKWLPVEQGLSDTAPWAAAADALEQEARLSHRWWARLASDAAARTRYRVLGDAERKPYEQPHLGIRLLMGPSGAQREEVLFPGDAFALSQAWMRYGDDETRDKIPTGWILDAGGIVTGMDWARKADGPQLLALAVIPHGDQENYNYEVEHQKPDFQRCGTVQVWAFRGGAVRQVPRPSPEKPVLRKTVCLHHGRARRVRWNPVSNHLAVLCGRGRVCVVEVDEQGDDDGSFVEHATASLMLDNEDSIKATCFAWATFNRLVVGYSDGSIALWSLHPSCMLSRHAVHHNLVVDLATAYPSQPYLVASTPVGGTPKLVDLSRPTHERTEVQTNAIAWQPNMLAYSGHVQGFYAVYPSANALNTTVGFMHQRFFPIARRIFVGESYNSSLAVGKTHPFLLIGTSDGCLWSMNPLVDLFQSRREQKDRLRLFQHEHRPKHLFPGDSPASSRGASRVMHGFAIEKGRSVKGEVKAPAGKNSRKTKKPDAVDAGEENDDDEAGGLTDPTRGIVYEPLSRITAVEWNPNQGFGWWAAAAMASGLVRVMDLGLDNVR
ncbi:uncharacterized protein UV8b_00079 [Ustilaginoidea virens]|uniref:Transcription factor TFIIIC complex subunit Tfc6 n=1 Tax=Ustilaginoidea virens TaxID=1159556 RepID=A0A8E5HI49_USTVR|nr:uncharacterized protein UV8b_00079 [Ustilaginoidea virens]QUC15838.1 hypothetical protein UV8b_00079 [Ustilaginoidea virens]